MIDDKQMKRRDFEFLFQVIQWLANGWIIRQYCFNHRPWKKELYIISLEEGKEFKFQFLRLSSFTIAAWVELILCTSELPHIVWIKSHLLDFTSAFSLIWWISHVLIVTSFITWRILTNCLSLITRLLPQKT